MYIHISVYIYIFTYIYMYIYIYIYRKQIHSTCIYNYRQHVGTLREYVCYAGRLKGSMYLVNGRLVVRIAAKTQQIRGWTSEMLPIACKQKGSGGATWGPIPFGGEGGDLAGGRRDHICIYISIYIYLYLYLSGLETHFLKCLYEAFLFSSIVRVLKAGSTTSTIDTHPNRIWDMCR